MITIPEIQEITNHCLSLLSCTEYLRGDASTEEAHSFAEEIFKSLRKLFIASMMRDKMLICISGLQGAGKTTLMKNFYGIDDSVLNPTRGRGERIPVLITEKENIISPRLSAIKIEKDPEGRYCQKTVTLSPNDYINATKGEDTQIMYLELFVPYKHTYHDGISFILLPGFEKKNDYWNNLIEFSVNSSDAAVFVFNETSFSNTYNDKYINIIKEKFGSNVIYAISGSDGSPDDNREVKQTCISTMEIPVNESDRVICTGAYNDRVKNQKWITEFKNALEKYAYRETQHYERNSTYLYREVNSIKNNLYQILKIVNNDCGEDIKSHHDDAILRACSVSLQMRKKGGK